MRKEPQESAEPRAPKGRPRVVGAGGRGRERLGSANDSGPGGGLRKARTGKSGSGEPGRERTRGVQCREQNGEAPGSLPLARLSDRGDGSVCSPQHPTPTVRSREDFQCWPRGWGFGGHHARGSWQRGRAANSGTLRPPSPVCAVQATICTSQVREQEGHLDPCFPNYTSTPPHHHKKGGLWSKSEGNARCTS